MKPVAVLTGPTASGKTAVALALAARRPIDLISMDSALVYRGMDIGTAKPSAQERAQVPHHLIDILDPAQAYSAAQFAGDARRLIAAIRARGREPLIVGGTLLYLKALRDGLDALPAADPALRAAIDAQARERGWPALHAELMRVDPVTAARLPPQDAQRIQRALEVWQATGRPLSSFHTRGEAAARPKRGERGDHDDHHGDDIALRIVSLEPVERAWLHARLAQRFEHMLQQGFVAEVQALRARGDLHPGLAAMRCVGYRQAWRFLDGEIDEAGFIEQALAASRQLAKRQLTWLRAMPERQVVACDAPDAHAQALHALAQALN